MHDDDDTASNITGGMEQPPYMGILPWSSLSANATRGPSVGRSVGRSFTADTTTETFVWIPEAYGESGAR